MNDNNHKQGSWLGRIKEIIADHDLEPWQCAWTHRRYGIGDAQDMKDIAAETARKRLEEFREFEQWKEERERKKAEAAEAEANKIQEVATANVY